jgi:hypothetical protein
MDGGNCRRGRDWPDLVGRRDVQLGPRGRLAKAGSGAASWLRRANVWRKVTSPRKGALQLRSGTGNVPSQTVAGLNHERAHRSAAVSLWLDASRG